MTDQFLVATRDANRSIGDEVDHRLLLTLESRLDIADCKGAMDSFTLFEHKPNVVFAQATVKIPAWTKVGAP